MKIKQDKNKVFCKQCKLYVDKSQYEKHQNTQRHLRATAGHLFWQKKKKQEIQKQEKSSFTVQYPEQEQQIRTKQKPKNIWCKMTDPMTGLDYYHNRLSGKTQKNRPIGIKDTELDIEYIQSQPDQQQDVQEYDQDTMVGQWVDINTNYAEFDDSIIQQEQHIQEINNTLDTLQNNNATVYEEDEEILVNKPTFEVSNQKANSFNKPKKKPRFRL